MMSVIADLTPIVADDRLAKRNALVLAIAQALAGGNNTVIAATAGIIGTMLASDPGLATLAGVGHGVRHLVRHAAARLSGAELRPPFRLADRFGGRDAGGPRVLRRGGAGLFPVVSGRHVRLRLLCRRAQFLSVRRDRYRQRRLQAQGDLVRAGRRRDGRHHRIGRRDRHQGLVGAVSVCGDLHRAIDAGRARRPRADAAQVAAADAARGTRAKSRPSAVGDRAAAAVHRRGRLRRRQLRHHEPGDDVGADRDGRLRPFGDGFHARHPMARARHVRAELHHRLT